ncbi:RNA-binding protein [Dellaglioa carnosa]|uniref:YlmH/Sll1252 family protein n=1 Tax=Dellaglioa carnosa TaxID=2995136 RepID=A0ABT4JK80_9LACO|nr:YlmH/Sll1252 family protein [Dellaglioa carnosa]MCZ2490766.1 YlmH/Sll1252 family protein [Dellaglioa carnosa]MCZ2493844.1 YlmH/Sll1252 family protein [Dellaglioa carnosa]MDK1730708.1 YlmH/Sll1252 family protein [Dellaglioa carnosa]
MNDAIYQHFRPDEKEIIDTLSDYIEQAKSEYRAVLTHFLNPREAHIATYLLGQSDEISMKLFGGTKDAERRRLLFYPAYFDVQDSDFDLQLIEIKYPVKFATLKHGQILGTLANAGLDREVLGDIVTDGQQWQVVVEKKMADYLINQIDRIGKIKVSLEEVSFSQIVSVTDEWQSQSELVASLRIDSVISAVYNMSRQNAKNLVNSEKVSLNWQVISKPDYELAEFDVLSIRGFGRIKLDLVAGMTRKDKYKLELSVLKK